MRARFLRRQFTAIQKQAQRLATKNGSEVCGLLLDNGYFLELVQTRNRARSGGGFCFYYREIRMLQRMARLSQHEIVGTFHSHPLALAEPGHSDLRHAVNKSLMLIFDVIGRSAKLWRIKDHKANKVRFSLIR
ncbi:MAG: hypothetical protein C5B50_10215 [Verrucomicrobia bacterium]|nr:MAG: hypothetical protein C5B50_10215 [Verrucomicrobiota bacterium]